jgi:sugar lactone lactonase YvrE
MSYRAALDVVFWVVGFPHRHFPARCSPQREHGAGLLSLLLIVTVIVMGAVPGWAQPAGTIITIAGTGLQGFSGDGGPTTQARLYHPSDVCVDRTGNLYIADRDNHRIRKIDTRGVITTVAGSGPSGLGSLDAGGYEGDGGPATQARLFSPFGVYVDGVGNLYIADLGNHRVRKVDTRGIITTVAGTDSAGFAGDGGPATQARLLAPRGVYVDKAGNLYIGDQGNNRVRKVTPDGMISTIAGSGKTGFSGDGGPATQASLTNPRGICVDEAGNLYIADSGNQRIRKVTPDGMIATIAGSDPVGSGEGNFSGDGGPATLATLRTPTQVRVDGYGNLYIADAGNLRVRKVDTQGIITTIAGSNALHDGPATATWLVAPNDVCVDKAGNLYITDTPGRCVRKVNSRGMITTVAGTGYSAYSGDGGPATQAGLFNPWSVFVDDSGHLYITDGPRVRRVDPRGFITTVAGTGDWGFAGDGGPATQARLNGSTGIFVDTAGVLYIPDYYRVRKVDTRGIITTVAGTDSAGFAGDGGPATQARLRGPWSLYVDQTGTLYIADRGNHRIRRVDPQGLITTIAGTGAAGFSGDGGPATQASLANPQDVYVDRIGTLYIVDSGNNRIRKIDPRGIITTVAGRGPTGFGHGGFSGDGGPATEAELAYPEAMFGDEAGNLYVVDGSNRRIRKIDPRGIITTVAGGGTASLGDGGPATRASLNSPSGVCMDNMGNLYVSDTFHERIRKIIGPIR